MATPAAIQPDSIEYQVWAAVQTWLATLRPVAMNHPSLLANLGTLEQSLQEMLTLSANARAGMVAVAILSEVPTAPLPTGGKAARKGKRR